MIKSMQVIRQKIRERSSLGKMLSVLLLLTIWGFFFWRALHTFGPSNNIIAIPYHSDSAIPVIMSNDDRPITVFNLYYYGADRWGGWPFLVAQFIHRATGFRWSEQSLYVMQALWIFCGPLILASLGSRRDRLLVVLVYIITLCLHGRLNFLLFSLSQVYAWQLTALLLGWYCLRRFFESHLESSTNQVVTRSQALWGLLTLLLSYFAIWSSPASILFLFFLLCVESGRMYLKTEGARAKLSGFRRAYTRGAVLILLATISELLQKMNYHRYGLKHFGNDFKTPFALDAGYFALNLKAQLHSLSQLYWWPLYLVTALALIVLGGGYLYLSVRKRRELRERGRAFLTSETMILSLACYGLATINFILVVTVNHVRLNNYDDRFLTLTYLFASISGLLMLFMMCDAAARFFKLGAYLRPLLISAGTLFLLLNFPAEGYSQMYQTLKETALTLSQRSPRGVLMGGYWETYVFTSLQTTDEMTPVPFEGQGYRTPWTTERLGQVDLAVVEYRHSKLGGTTEGPPAHLQQYGNSLRLIDPKWYENGEYSFALYHNDKGASLRP
jgi:hypothetical protein